MRIVKETEEVVLLETPCLVCDNCKYEINENGKYFTGSFTKESHEHHICAPCMNLWFNLKPCKQN
jgi:hypothetical protein